MHRLSIFTVAAALVLAGCHTANTRIAEHSAAFAALDAATQKNIRAGRVEPGYTTDMVYMALGRPAGITTDAGGRTVWTYKIHPVTAHNETIQAGFRRRVVYDPVKRTDDIIVEPIDEKAFPNLVPHTLRLVFDNGRLLSVERINRV